MDSFEFDFVHEMLANPLDLDLLRNFLSLSKQKQRSYKRSKFLKRSFFRFYEQSQTRNNSILRSSHVRKEEGAPLTLNLALTFTLSWAGD
jgi:hypothetical protein